MGTTQSKAGTNLLPTPSVRRTPSTDIPRADSVESTNIHLLGQKLMFGGAFYRSRSLQAGEHTCISFYASGSLRE
eukprot:1484915-Prymnesium_polylepis.1